MSKFFISVYRFFRKFPAVMWGCLVVSSLVFAFFALKLTYKEDLLQLLPPSDKANESEIAFGELSVKDKIFMEFIAKEGADSISQEDLAAACDDFMDSLLLKDTAKAYIKHALYRGETEWAVNGLDYALAHFPAYIPETAYDDFDSLLTRNTLLATMADNVEKMSNDYEGTVTSMICYDPAGLRNAFLGKLTAATGNKDISDGVSFGSYMYKDGHLFSPDGTVVLAFITPVASSFNSQVTSRIGDFISETEKEFYSTHEGIDVLYHGAAMRSAGNSGQIKKDLALTLTVSMIVIILLLLICFKDFRSLMMIVLPILYGTIFAMACIYWMKGSMSLMALGIGAVVLGISVSYVLHVMLHFKFTADAETVLKDQSKPVCMSCLTTIGAFAGLLFTQSPLLHDFGLFAIFALVGSTFASLVFLPQFFDPEKNNRSEKAFQVIDRINSYPIDRNYPLAIAIVAVVVLCFFFAGKVGFDSNLQNLNYMTSTVARSEQVYAEKMNGNLRSGYYAAVGSTLDEALENNVAVKSAMDSLEKAGTIVSYSALASFLPTTETQQENIDRWSSYWTEKKVSETMTGISYASKRNGLDPEIFDPFFALVEGDYAPESILDSGVLPEELSSNFVEKTDGKYVVFTSALMDPERKTEVGDAISAVPHGLVVDPFYYAADLVEVVNKDYGSVLYISSIFVLFVLLLTFKDLIIAILAFLPMFLSWFVVEGIMAMTGIEFNLFNIVISSFIFGVGVDYSIFIMDGLLASARGIDDKLLVRHKAAILLSAFILIVVVASLLLAKSPVIRSVGSITLIGMASTILIAYCLLPLAFRLVLRIEPIRKMILRKK